MFSQQKTINSVPLYGNSEYLLQCEPLNPYFFITYTNGRRNTQTNNHLTATVGVNYHWNALESQGITHYHNPATLINVNPRSSYQSIYITQPFNTTFFSPLVLTNKPYLLLTPSLEVYRNNASIPLAPLSSIAILPTPLTSAYDAFINGLNAYMGKRGIKTFDQVRKSTLFGHGIIYLSGITHTFPQTCLIEKNQSLSNYFFVNFYSTRINLIEAKKIAAFLNNRFGRNFCEYTPHFNTHTSRVICFSLEAIKKHWDSIVTGLDQSLQNPNRIKKTAPKNHPFFSRNHASVLPSAACPFMDGSANTATEMAGSSSKHFKLK